MLILTGPPGVGKTTVARILARRSERGVHLEADHFFYFIRSGFIDPWDPESGEQNEMVMRIAAEAAARYAAAGYETILDGIVIPRWTLGVIRETLEAAGVPASYAVLRASQPTCLARFREREGGEDLLEPGIVNGIGAEFDDLEAFEGHAIEVDGMDAEEAATLVAERLAGGELAL